MTKDEAIARLKSRGCLKAALALHRALLAEAGRKGGQAKSEAKRKAVRENALQRWRMNSATKPGR